MVALAAYYNDLAKEIHKDNVLSGWWDDPDECLFQKLQLVSTEIAEATEGARKNLMDDHLPHLPMEEVEYADAMIRILDLGGRLNLKYDEDANPHPYCIPTNSVGHQQLGINAAIVSMADSMRTHLYAPDKHIISCILQADYSVVVRSIVQVTNNRGLGLFTAIQEKRAYNAVRADHKRENREKPHGKTF